MRRQRDVPLAHAARVRVRPHQARGLVVVGAVLLGAALCVAITCAADMMGDLKTGYLVGSQPKRQRNDCNPACPPAPAPGGIHHPCIYGGIAIPKVNLVQPDSSLIAQCTTCRPLAACLR